jgi:hypothetical protein
MFRFLHYLRIAFSVTCGLAFVLLIVLWVRSYWFTDGTKNLEIVSMRGKMYFYEAFAYTQTPTRADFLPANWMLRKYLGLQTLIGPPGRNLVPYGDGVAVPYCCVAPFILMLAVVPWLRWRFSLSTLLIATTLVAVVLGLIVWAARK